MHLLHLESLAKNRHEHQCRPHRTGTPQATGSGISMRNTGMRRRSVNGIAVRSWAWARLGVLALLWGSTFLWIKLALTALSPVQLTLARCVLGALTLVALCFGMGQRLPGERRIWGHLFVAAFFCNALPFSLFSIGEQTVDSGVAGVLNATTPLWTLLVGVAIGTERGIRPIRLGGLLLGFGGVVLISAPWQHAESVGWGSLAIVAAAASYAVGFAYMGRHLTGKGTPTISLSAAQLIAASAWAALTLPAGGLEPVHISQQGLIAVVVLGIFATGITFHLTFRIIADEGATNAATVGYLLPVVSVVLGAIVLDEEFSVRVAVGMLVVLVGVGMTRRQKPAIGTPQVAKEESVHQ
jgi:drug/metabolite transporter (DMT)-like permease